MLPVSSCSRSPSTTNTNNHHVIVIDTINDEDHDPSCCISSTTLCSSPTRRPDDRFASISRLVEMCILSFTPDGDTTERHFPQALFLVHQWWLSLCELCAQFIALYKTATKRCTICASGVQHVRDECDCVQFRMRICQAVGRWIRSCPMHFDANAQLCKMIDRLQKMVLADGFGHQFASLLDVSSVPSYAWLRNVSVRNPIMRQVSLSFEQWSPDEIATSLTHIERKLLCRITFNEYKQYACSGSLMTSPILERSISVFNSLSNWVQCMVLSKSTPKERADIITKFANVGKHLLKLYNFNTLMSVIGGITHSSIARLTKTNACLTLDIKRDLSQLTELLSNQCNYGNYRKALDESRQYRIPIIGVHLKDLISVQNALTDYDDIGQVNCKKLSQLAAVFSHLILDLDRKHNLPDPNMDLINTLKVSLDIHYKEDDIYELSLKREPRTLLNFQSSTHKQVVFADWAAGVCSAPDPDTVNKHVSAMVDAVFKHYDHDRDGYISKAEFELIAGNFPFIDPFVTIDADRDGQISRAEMKLYFVRVNQQSVAFRRGFKHNFHETTFLTPTICFHCNKLLWGLIRQGFKCKDCGLPVHRICKDSAVAECRRKPSQLQLLQQQSPSIRTTSLPESDAIPISTIPEETNQLPTSNNATQRRKLFLNIRSKPNRLRTVSTTSDSPSPEPPPSAMQIESAIRDRALVRLRLPSSSKSSSSGKPRARSETNECYRCTSPEYTGEVDILPSLASEEVFEDESSVASLQH